MGGVALGGGGDGVTVDMPGVVVAIGGDMTRAAEVASAIVPTAHTTDAGDVCWIFAAVADSFSSSCCCKVAWIILLLAVASFESGTVGYTVEAGEGSLRSFGRGRWVILGTIVLRNVRYKPLMSEYVGTRRSTVSISRKRQKGKNI